MTMSHPHEPFLRLRERSRRAALLRRMRAVATVQTVALSVVALTSVPRRSEPDGEFAVFEECPLGDRTGRESGKEPGEGPSWLMTTTNQKLEWLISAGVTSAEIALATGGSLRAVEDRRRSLRNGKSKTRVAKLDSGIDGLFSIFSLLESHQIEPSNIRAWLIGRSAFLEEQRPAILLAANEFELVREAAIAYASNETPAEFLAGRGPLPRPAEPAEV